MVEDFKKTSDFSYHSRFKKWHWFFKKLNYVFLPAIKHNFLDQEQTKIWKYLDISGSRNNGKTKNLILYQWHLANKYPKIKFIFNWVRLIMNDSKETFRTIQILAPEEYRKLIGVKKRVVKDRVNQKAFEFNNQMKIITWGNATFRVLAATGRFNTGKQFQHGLLGFELDPCDVRFLVFEESFVMTTSMRTAVKLVARDQKVLFTINLLNPYLGKNSDLVNDIDKNLPFDSEKMGYKKLKGADDYTEKKLEKIKGYQWIELDDQERIIWKINHIPLYKANLMSKDYLKELWNESIKDDVRADVILWGKTGRMSGGIYGDYINKIIFINWANNAFDWRVKGNWRFSTMVVGIDFGYVNDKTTLVISFLNQDKSNMRILETKIIKDIKKSMDVSIQIKKIAAIVKDIYNKYGQFCKNRWITINAVEGVQLSVQSTFSALGLKDLFMFFTFKKKPKFVIERVNLIRHMITRKYLEIIDTTNNRLLIREMEDITLKKNRDIKSAERIGNDDIIEAFENSLFPIWNDIEANLFKK